MHTTSTSSSTTTKRDNTDHELCIAKGAPTAGPMSSGSYATSCSPSQRPIRTGTMVRDTSMGLDYGGLKRHDSVQERIKRFIFCDNDVDWRMIPVLDDTPYDRRILLHRRDLRCHASRQYLQEVMDDFRKPKCDNSTTNSDGTIVIDGEDFVDMIG